MQSIAAMLVTNNDLPSIVYRQRNDYEGWQPKKNSQKNISIIMALKARRLQGPHHGRHGVREEEPRSRFAQRRETSCDRGWFSQLDTGEPNALLQNQVLSLSGIMRF